MRDWKRWTAVLLAGSLAFTAADDMKLIVQAYEMQNEQGQESYQAESKSKLDDLKEKAVLFQEFQGEEQRFDGTRAVDVSDHAEQIHKIETGSVVFRFKASKKADGVLLGAKDKTIDLPTDLNRGSDCTSFFIRANEKFRMVYKHTAAEHVGPASFSDGNWHTVVVSSQNEKSMRLTIDGQEINRRPLQGLLLLPHRKRCGYCRLLRAKRDFGFLHHEASDPLPPERALQGFPHCRVFW